MIDLTSVATLLCLLPVVFSSTHDLPLNACKPNQDKYWQAPHPDDCTMYVQCDNGTAVSEHLCSNGWMFDYKKLACFLNGECFPGEGIAFTCQGQPDYTRLPDTEYCSWFTECVSNQDKPYECPVDKPFFDYTTSACTEEAMGYCYPGSTKEAIPEEGNSTISTTTGEDEDTTTTGEDEDTTTTGEDEDTTTTGEDEDTTTTEQNDDTTTTEKNDDTTTTEKDDDTTTTEKDDDTTTTEAIRTSTDINSNCRGSKTTNVPHATDCKKYYHCVNGRATEETCAGVLKFDWITLTCRIDGRCFGDTGSLASKLNFSSLLLSLLPLLTLVSISKSFLV